MKHAALLIPGIERIGGAERQLLLLAHGLRRRGWRVTIIALTGTAGAASRDLECAGIEFLTLRMRKGVADPRGWIRLALWLHRQNPDVVHAHLPHATWMARWMRLLRPGQATIDTLHSSSTGKRTRHIGYRISNWLAGRVTAVSEAVAASHLAAGLVDANKLVVVPNGVDTEVFCPDRSLREPVRRALGLGEEFLWVAAGRLEPVKDYSSLLRAFAMLPGNVHLAIAGDGQQRDALHALAADLGLTERVHFLGAVAEVEGVMQAADAAVLSSLWEGLPMALLEAGACSLPAVATDVSGSREAIVEGETGWLAPAADPAVLAAAMGRLMQAEPGARCRMGAMARARVSRLYGLDTVLDRWERLYEECEEECGRRGRETHTSPALAPIDPALK